MSEWNAMTFEGKDTILRVVREQADAMFAMIEDPATWEAPTACEGWTTRDVVGHIVDTTEGYFRAFDAARGEGDGPAGTWADGDGGARQRGGDRVPVAVPAGDGAAAARRLRQDAGDPHSRSVPKTGPG